MSLKRRSYEAGHRPKFLVIIDDSTECDRAVYYASRRAARIGAGVVMLLVIEPHDRHQQWLGVADIMKAEAYEAADQKLDAFSARANGVAGITPERVIRDGDTSEEILKLIDEDEDIAILVLAAGTGKDGPGPLVAGVGIARLEELAGFGRVAATSAVRHDRCTGHEVFHDDAKDGGLELRPFGILLGDGDEVRAEEHPADTGDIEQPLGERRLRGFGPVAHLERP